MERKQYRQGDVVLEQEGARYYHTIPSGTPSVGKKRQVTVAEGEKTGHSHVVECEQEIELFERDGTLYLRIPKEAEMKHQEHATVTLPAGDYKVVRQAEYDPVDAYRPVLD